MSSENGEGSNNVNCAILSVLNESSGLIEDLLLELVVVLNHVSTSLCKQVENHAALFSLVFEVILDCLLKDEVWYSIELVCSIT